MRILLKHDEEGGRGLALPPQHGVEGVVHCAHQLLQKPLPYGLVALEVQTSLVEQVHLVHLQRRRNMLNHGQGGEILPALDEGDVVCGGPRLLRQLFLGESTELAVALHVVGKADL